jgi:ABC-type glycerol-3-phosphate transport system substrate-binding protein
MKTCRPVSRRAALKLAAGAGALPLVHIRTAAAAGKLSIAFLDHWVPAGSAEMRRQVAAWAKTSKVEVQADFITSIGNKLLLTIAEEAQARSGHDATSFYAWQTQQYARQLDPVDDIVERLSGVYGPTNKITQYLGRVEGHWIAVPTSYHSANLGPCGRIDLFDQHCGIDLQEMYPAGNIETQAAAQWTWDTLLGAAEKSQKAGYPFGLGISPCADSVDFFGALFAAYGAELVDEGGSFTVDSDQVRQVLEYAVRLAQFLPGEVYSYDDASNNRALISGKSALIFNPPSAWAVAKRDAPHVAEQCWTFSSPAGSAGRFVPYRPYFWGVWSFSRNKSAAKDLIEYLCQREQVEARCNTVMGFDIPPYESMADFPIWERVEPPPGTVFNYPIRPHHHAQPVIAGAPAPPEFAVQMYNAGIMPLMVAQVTQRGRSIEQAIAWARRELEGARR